MEFIELKSRAIKAVRYDAEQKILEIINARTGVQIKYFGVPVDLFRGLMLAESKGRYFQDHIGYNRFKYEIV